MQVVLTPASLGRRVAVRVRVHPTAAGPAYTDVVGVLTRLSESEAELLTRQGSVQVPLSAVVAARSVAAARRDILALQRIAADGWRSEQCATMGAWVLRANSGWSRRGNSVLPLGQIDRPLDSLLDELARWYADRGLPALICLPIVARGLLDTELGRRNWAAEAESMLLSRPMTAAAAAAAAPIAQRPVELDNAPTDAWYGCGPDLPEPARQLLCRHPAATFASISDGNQTVAIARGVLDAGWLGISMMRVRPDFRRGGAATALLNALQRWGTEGGATHCYLQVELANRPTVALYEKLGFTEHHRYHYRRMPPRFGDRRARRPTPSRPAEAR